MHLEAEGRTSVKDRTKVHKMVAWELMLTGSEHPPFRDNWR